MASWKKKILLAFYAGRKEGVQAGKATSSRHYLETKKRAAAANSLNIQAIKDNHEVEIKILSDEIKKLNERLALQIKKTEKVARSLSTSLKKSDQHRVNTVHLKNKIRFLLDKVQPAKYREAFFKKKLKWTGVQGMPFKCEMMLRAIHGYEALRSEFTYAEFMYLCIGGQIECFNREMVEHRFGKENNKYFLRDTKKMIDDGLMRRQERKGMYYLSAAGWDKLEAIVYGIYTKRSKSYWPDLIEKLKVRKW